MNTWCHFPPYWRRFLLLFGFMVSVQAISAHADVCATDDLGEELCLAEPVQRIASLSPGATELLYAAGAGDKVVAVVDFSDYPPEAQEKTFVGRHDRIDLERLVSLRPDLVIGWISGNPTTQLETLVSLGIPVFHIEPRDFEGVASALERLSDLAGTEAIGRPAAAEFRQGIAALRESYSDRVPVSVFYEIWDEPLMTINDEHLIGQIIDLCGGENIFGELSTLAPRIDIESLLTADPDAIVAGGMGEADRTWLDAWKQFPGLTAVRENHLFFVPPSLIQRPTPRVLEGSRIFCAELDQARGTN